MIKQKKAAIELSIGTIVIIVIAMSMLILGIVLVRQVMCAGINLTKGITEETESQLYDLFGSNEEGIKCSGEDGDKTVFGSGDTRPIVCVSNQGASSTRRMELDSVTLKRGRIGSITAEADLIDDENLFIVKEWEGTVKNGRDSFVLASLDLDQDIDNSVILLKYKEYIGDSTEVHETHDLQINIEPVSGFKAAIC